MPAHRKLKAVGVHIFAGLFTQGIVDAGYDVMATLEDGNFGVATHRFNFPNVKVHDVQQMWPIDELRDEHLDLVYANSACSGLSGANAGRGLENCSNNGLATAHTTALHLKPRAFVVESVQALFSLGDPMVQGWEREWQAAGYNTCRLLESADHLGLPQVRRRALFIAAQANLDFSYTPTAPVTVREAIYDLRDAPLQLEAQDYPTHPGSVYGTFIRRGAPQLTWHMPCNPTKALASCLPYLKPGKRIDSLPDEVMAKTYWISRERPQKPQARPCLLYRRLDYGCASTTLTGDCHWFHPEFDRLLTVREQARLMGVPDTFQFSAKSPRTPYQEVGKAVSPIVGSWIGHQLADILRDPTGRAHKTLVDLSGKIKTKEKS